MIHKKNVSMSFRTTFVKYNSKADECILTKKQDKRGKNIIINYGPKKSVWMVYG